MTATTACSLNSPPLWITEWQLLLLSLYLFVGATADLLAAVVTSACKATSSVASDHRLTSSIGLYITSSKQSAGQRYRPEERSGLPKLG